jgi:PAS domain-containing protein
MTTLDLSSIIRGLREPVLPVGREGAVVVANPSESKLFGRTASENERLPTLAKANRALQDEQRWRAALESSAIGIMMADFTGRLFVANAAFQNMLGYAESELYQLTFLGHYLRGRPEGEPKVCQATHGRHAAKLPNREALLSQGRHFSLGA